MTERCRLGLVLSVALHSTSSGVQHYLSQSNVSDNLQTVDGYKLTDEGQNLLELLFATTKYIFSVRIVRKKTLFCIYNYVKV